MSVKRKARTQTTPQGAAIPVPKRKDVLRDLRKIATSEPPERPETRPPQP